MRITLTSVFVSDQDEALRFYTETLGFVKKHDVPVGNSSGLPSSRPMIQTGPSSCLNQMTTRYHRHIRKGYLTKASQRRPLALRTSVQSVRN